MSPEFEVFAGVLAAILGGAAVGAERQRSGNASGPAGGIRTFTLLGATAGIGGWLAGRDHALIAGLLLAGAVCLIVVGYLRSSAPDVDALTMSMTRSISSGTAIDAACRAILMGVIANSLMKSGIAIAIGDRRFAWQTAASLAAMVAAGGAMLFLR